MCGWCHLELKSVFSLILNSLRATMKIKCARLCTCKYNGRYAAIYALVK